MSRKREQELTGIADSLEQRTIASSERADRAAKEQQKRLPKVESIVNYLQERRERNGFGEDFTIAMTPRRML
jgi:hypothetical protein